jgi:CubicO group peptidase (beta-lactamase class C family)
MRSLVCLLVLIAAVVGSGVRPAMAAAPAAPPVAAPSAAPALTRADLEAWLDGFLPYALQNGDIAGAVVVVVKDGQVLLQKGYGYADVASRRPVDPHKTLFRAASISKLFTWTAVIQLVEQGKLDLDKDVNAYLDFRIPPRDGKPITLRNLMTHTSGFEEHVKNMSAKPPAALMAFDIFERTQTPTRIFPPGETPAYSNYGAGLAAYIVERVSGERFDDYVARHITGPLGMTDTTFAQPLPRRLVAQMSTGYVRGSGPAKPFEMVNPPPSGAISIGGDDMARFMLAHLGAGRLGDAQILRPETSQRMQAVAFQAAPPLNGMALGFFQEDLNGHRIRGHGGDLTHFHSALHLLPDDGVGLYISMNSGGVGPATSAIRDAFLRGFMNRYYPAPPAVEPPTWKDAKAHGRQIAGFYLLSRRGETSVTAAQNLLQQVEVTVDDKGLVRLPLLDNAFGGPPRSWREVAPYVWREVGGSGQLRAVMKDGKVAMLFTDAIPQFAVLQPAPPFISQAWSRPASIAGLLVLVATVLLWPIAAIVRWRTGTPFKLSGRRAMFFRLSRAGALVSLVFLVAWIALFLAASASLIPADATLDVWIRALQVVAVVALFGAVLAILNVAVVWFDRSASWWARLSSPLAALGCLTVAWFIFASRALAVSLNY